MASQKFRLAPLISLVETDSDSLTTISPDVLVSVWICAAPKPVSLIGPFEFHRLGGTKFLSTILLPRQAFAKGRSS